ncbi:hypothetical protein BT93_H1694 [Corymbia citriodora subsp. variegata]|nr:hypothetical protein BT93_H1694 [Corymbia citriodora subsp. variegata]
MKQNNSTSCLQLARPIIIAILTILFIVITHCAGQVEAKRSRMNKHHGHNHHHAPAPASAPHYGDTESSMFNVLSFGAKGDGVSDDSKAILAAWKAACMVPSATLVIPQGLKFLVKPISFKGPCMPNLVLQIDGIVQAPPKVGSWKKSSLFQWLNFKWIQNFTVQGTGTVDGQGSEWWSRSQMLHYDVQGTSKHVLGMKPTALRFYSSCNVNVRGISIVNSPLCHLKFDNSRGIKISNITISSPEDSPNTDGIHLQNSQHIEIEHSNIGCGDDCVSVQTGCSDVYIHHISCGPGHGISLGGLGKDKSVACVSNIVVDNLSLESTLYGVRIKTWQGGVGSVKNVSFSNVQVSDVKVPVMIDQFYCDKKFCKNQTGGIAISGIKFDQFVGTYAVQPLHIACSHDVPCTDVDLVDIQLKPLPGLGGSREALCYNSYGKAVAPLVPASIDDCLRSDGGSIKRIARSHDVGCQ